jgi:hypothetical protein
MVRLDFSRRPNGPSELWFGCGCAHWCQCAEIRELVPSFVNRCQDVRTPHFGRRETLSRSPSAVSKLVSNPRVTDREALGSN